MNENRHHFLVVIASLMGGVVLIALLSLLFAPSSAGVEKIMGDILLDRRPKLAPYPFTIQNLMWLIFCFGLGELWLRFNHTNREARQMKMSLLPEDGSTILRLRDMAPIYKKVREKAEQGLFLDKLIARITLQFQLSQSINQSNSLLNSSLELYQHTIDLKYSMLRYIVWLIPTLGFIGTVIGIALALADAGNVPDVSDTNALRPWMNEITSSLGVAFYTTLLALILSAILVFLLHIVQVREETTLNQTGQYCLDNLINRLYEK